MWNQHFCDQELLSVIQQDVIRTFPGVEFFRKPAIQEIMTNVLFIYARCYPNMCYRQGMHGKILLRHIVISSSIFFLFLEVLAPIIFVVHCDQQALAHVKSFGSSLNPDIIYLLNPDYLEADSYEIFTRIMDGIESYYRVNDISPTANGHFPNVEPAVSIRIR